MNAQWRLAARPEGLFKPSDFAWREEETKAPADGEALVRVLYLSLDPTNRGWAAADSYLPAVAIGDVMRGYALGRVIDSRAAGLLPGDLVQGLLGWQRYAVVPASALTKLSPLPLPLEAHLGCSVMSGSRHGWDSWKWVGRGKARRSSSRLPPAPSARSWARSARSRACAWSVSRAARRSAAG